MWTCATPGFGIEETSKLQSRFPPRGSHTSWLIDARRPSVRWVRPKPVEACCKSLAASRGETGGLSRDKPKRSSEEEQQKHSLEDLARDESFMMAAMVEAKKAYQAGEIPVGAVLVNRGVIVARAHNRVEAENDPTAHAEMLCIRQAAQILGGWRLIDSALYVTLEPCPMCAGAILQARVGEIVWGARNTLLGADGSWIRL